MNKIVLIVVLVGVIAILVGFSVSTGLTIYKSNDLDKNTKFPPWPSKCPDYWSVIGGGTCRDGESGDCEIRCQNVHKIGMCKAGDIDNIMDFSEPIFRGSRGMKYKCNWSKQCDAPWEGVDSIC